MGIIDWAERNDLLDRAYQPIGVYGKFKPINYVASPDMVFVSEYFTGSFQRNSGQRLTYDERPIALALMQELGVKNIGQMSQRQADTVFELFASIVRDAFAYQQAALGRKAPMVYNATSEQVERGNVPNAPSIPVVKRWTKADVIVIGYGVELWAVHPNGEYATISVR